MYVPIWHNPPELNRVTDTPVVPEIPETHARTKRTSYTRKQGDFSFAHPDDLVGRHDER